MGRKKKVVEEVKTDNKAQKAKLITRELNKQFGYEALKPASEEKERERIPFALDILNEMTGGGIPLGMFSILWGNKSCFIAGTKVLMADYSWKNIENIQIGEEVFGFDESGKKTLRPTRVLNTFKRETDKTILIKTDQGEVITTDEHPFLKSTAKNANWVKAKVLRYNTPMYHFPQYNRNYEWKRGWILGAVLSDGSISRGVFFYNKNEVLIKKYIENLEEIYQIKNPSVIRKYNGVFQVSAKNNFILKSLLRLEEDVLNNQSNLSVDFCRGLIAGFYDGDGTSGYPTRQGISLCNTNLPLLKAFKKIFIKLNFKGNISKGSPPQKREIRGKVYNCRAMYGLPIWNYLKFYLTCLPYSKVHYAFAIKNLGKQYIKFKARGKEKTTVYNIETALHTYVANGFPVHNCGKTTHTYGLIANAQKMGKHCAFFDLENSFDTHWAKSFGVDVDKLLIGHFDTAEQAMDTFISLADKEAIDFVVLDSVQALSPTGEQHKKKSEKIKTTSDETMALLARKLSQFFRMSAGRTYRGNVGLLLIGQARVDLGGFIPIQKISGGNALEHWASLILHIRRGTKSNAPTYKFKNAEGKRREIIIGFDTAVVLDKKKIPFCAPEKTEVHFPFFESMGWVEPSKEQIESCYKDWIDFEKESEEE